jgi:hypothetical protein
MEIGHRGEVIYQVNRQAALEQRVPPRVDRNVLVGYRSAKCLRIFLCNEMHVLGLRAGQVIDFADVWLLIGQQPGDHSRHAFDGDRLSLSLAERQPNLIRFPDRIRSDDQEEAFQHHRRSHMHQRQTRPVKRLLGEPA